MEDLQKITDPESISASTNSTKIIGDEFDLLGQNNKSSKPKENAPTEQPKRGDGGDWL